MCQGNELALGGTATAAPMGCLKFDIRGGRNSLYDINTDKRYDMLRYDPATDRDIEFNDILGR